MPDTDFPPPGDLLPHSGPMLLLDSIIEHSGERTVSRIVPSQNEIFIDEGDQKVPAWVGLEYMGQTACSHIMLKTLGEQNAPAGGILVSAREISLDFEGFRTDRPYHVEAIRIFDQDRLQACRSTIREPGCSEVLSQGRLHAFISEDLDDLREAGE